MDNHAFCRSYLSDVMVQVIQRVTTKQRKHAYVHQDSLAYAFHGPDGFYFHLATRRCCCKWWARASGWEAYLDAQGQYLDEGGG